jgi:hypothetical protein
MPGTVEGTSIIQDGYSPYKVNGRDAGDPLKQTIQKTTQLMNKLNTLFLFLSSRRNENIKNDIKKL